MSSDKTRISSSTLWSSSPFLESVSSVIGSWRNGSLTDDTCRIITITGAGGVGKTAIALRIAYSFLSEQNNPFDAIIWFSAKSNKLTEEGIVKLESMIKTDEQLIEDILKIIDQGALKNLKTAKALPVSYKNYLYNIFSSQNCLLIIDNLETIIRDDSLINFIKDVPRPSQVLITSRKGLGEIERRYPITDMLEKDAIQLFRIVAKDRNKLDLLRLDESIIAELVKRVKCYPLLIKWSIGQVCLGKEIDAAFSQIFAGESEIAKFSFNDVFSLISEDSKNVLYSMIIYGDKPASRYILMHLANLSEEQIEDAIRELVMTSFVIPENKQIESEVMTEYSMLALTRGFIEHKLDEDEKKRDILSTRYYHLLQQLQNFEKSKSSYSQSLFSLGIKAPEEQVAFNYVKAAKNFYYDNNIEKAEENFEQAIKIAPKFAYAIGEYSKFEFNRGHIPEGLKLAEKAIHVDPENYHAWFNYGISLRKDFRLPDAINALKKAKELNSKHLPIYNELGRAYSLSANYEQAETEFKEALKEEKYPNIRHKAMTHQSLAENYIRWSEAFRARKDLDGEIEKLNKAQESISNALEIDSKDKFLYNTLRKIDKNFGIFLSMRDGFAEGKPFLEKSIQVIKVGNKSFEPDNRIKAEVCFYLAALNLNQNGPNDPDIENWINTGLACCEKKSKFYYRLNDLKMKLSGKTRI